MAAANRREVIIQKSVCHAAAFTEIACARRLSTPRSNVRKATIVTAKTSSRIRRISMEWKEGEINSCRDISFTDHREEHGDDEQREEDRRRETGGHDECEGALHIGAGTGGEEERKEPEDRGERSHEDGAEPPRRSFDHCFPNPLPRHMLLLHFLFVLSFNERKTEAFTKSVLQVHDDHRSRLYGIAEEGNKADPNGNGAIHAAKEEREYATDEAKGAREEHHAGGPHIAIRKVQECRHQQECERHHYEEALCRALLILVLTGP